MSPSFLVLAAVSPVVSLSVLPTLVLWIGPLVLVLSSGGGSASFLLAVVVLTSVLTTRASLVWTVTSRIRLLHRASASGRILRGVLAEVVRQSLFDVAWVLEPYKVSQVFGFLYLVLLVGFFLQPASKHRLLVFARVLHLEYIRFPIELLP